MRPTDTHTATDWHTHTPIQPPQLWRTKIKTALLHLYAVCSSITHAHTHTCTAIVCQPYTRPTDVYVSLYVYENRTHTVTLHTHAHTRTATLNKYKVCCCCCFCLCSRSKCCWWCGRHRRQTMPCPFVVAINIFILFSVLQSTFMAIITTSI